MIYPYPFGTQLPPEHGGSGWADCFQGCLGAYLKAAGKLPASMSDADVLNAVSLASRGTPDASDNAYTTLAQGDAALQHYGLPAIVSGYQQALNAPWSICLVDGTAITKADGTKPYPASWFNYETGPDHFCLWGPGFQGAFNWIMNPLDPGKAWAQYDLTIFQRAFNCAYLLPDLPGQVAVKKTGWTALRKFGLLTNPVHGSTALAVVPSGGTGVTWCETRTVAGEVWQKCQWRDRLGWCPKTYITIA